MGIFSLFRKKDPWAWNAIPKVWDTKRVAIYDFIATKFKENDGISIADDGLDLPDDEIFYQDKKIKYIAGALDGAMFTMQGYGNDVDAAKEVFGLLVQAIQCDQPHKKDIANLYNRLQQTHALDIVMPLGQLIFDNAAQIDPTKTLKLALWLAYKAPDREPVKLALYLLQLTTGKSAFKKIFMLYAYHDEFTLAAAIALSCLEDCSQYELWPIAQSVYGWGKIHLVQLLAAKVTDSEIKEWLLLEGYKNLVMDEYLVYTCAEAGGLLEALKNQDPDEKLLIAAGEILLTLIRGDGGPAESIDDYEDAPEALELYLQRISHRELSIGHFTIIRDIHDFVLPNETLWKKRLQHGWSEESRKNIEEKTQAFLSDPTWVDKMWLELKSEKQEHFYDATQIAQQFGIDIWDFYYERQKSFGGVYWTDLLSTTDPDRVRQTIDLARENVSKDVYYRWLTFVCQGLQNSPGQGYDLIKIALQSQDIQDRYAALRTLDKWGKENWPADAALFLDEMLQNETEEEVREFISRVLNDDIVTGRIRPETIPPDWVGRKLKSSKKGYCWYDPQSNDNAVFIYRNDNAEDYVVVVNDGLQLDKDGNPILGTSMPND